MRKGQKDMPDLDTDFPDTMKMKEILIKDWGINRVVPISNFNTLQLKSLIKDISKFYDIPFQEVNEVTNKMMEEATPLAKAKHNITAGVYVPTYDECVEYSETFSNFIEKYPLVSEHIKNLQGMIRSVGRHAGGVVVTENADECMPLISNKGVLQSPWTEGQTVRHLEPNGLIKVDILGLETIKMFEMCITHILKNFKGIKEPKFSDVKKFYDENISPEVINFDDQKVYETIFQKGKWAATFQFSQEPAQNFCQQVKPQSINEISNITSIFRPGPMEAQVPEQYLEAKNNKEFIQYDHKLIKEVLGDTYGFLIYQEQLAMLAHKLGDNISLEEGNQLRKVLTKKGTGKEDKVKKALYEKFLNGCLKNGLSNSKANELWEKMNFFAKYGFNRCLHKSAQIETRNGIVNIENIKAGDEVYSKNGFIKVKNVYKQGSKKLVKIKTKLGNELILTLDHKLETPEGMKTLKEILKHKLKIKVRSF